MKSCAAECSEAVCAQGTPGNTNHDNTFAGTFGHVSTLFFDPGLIQLVGGI